MNTTEAALWDRVSAVDLGPIRFKLINCDEGSEPWTPEQVARVEPQYRQYLFLTGISDGAASIVPSQEVDHFWHVHILDTRKYAEDCDMMFGHFLHHFPYLGMRGEEDKKLLESSYATTIAMRKHYFGDQVDADEEVSSCKECGVCSSCADLQSVHAGASKSVCSNCSAHCADTDDISSVRPRFDLPDSNQQVAH